ncbi:class I SAM-dependent methyltransferase [Teredinibacter turnerae]|uniref:class I SAM-dependent methyltransferase n=1 Tax=Teredinibacter turnerae TaxID=2426 RepID=UPI0003782EE7|nr:class I SAM-dependent methyltransferase [Teredinibacter turnerae]
METKSHWENVYTTKDADAVSWFQPHATRSLALINKLVPDTSASVLDVGGGASTLVDDLLAQGFSNVSVLDLSANALEVAKKRLGCGAASVNWLVADVTQLDMPPHSIDVWHDRAVFHFLTEEADRQRYIQALMKSVKPGGFVIVATFAENGPEQCSGLPVRRYSASGLHSEFGAQFQLLGHENEIHHTPFNTSQHFVYCYCRLEH